MYVPTEISIPTWRLVWIRRGYVEPSKSESNPQVAKDPILMPWLALAAELSG